MRWKQKIIGVLSIVLFSNSIFANDFTLQLLHFSDIDGNDASILENVDDFAALVNAFRNDPIYGSNTLLVSSGDNIMPGARFYAAKHPTVENITGSNEPGHGDIAMMNAMGVQASALGIQDFAAGTGELQDAIQADGSNTARFPHLAVNIDFSVDKDFQIGKNGSLVSELAGKVAGYAVANVNNELIGIIGVVTPNLTNLVNLGKLVVRPEPTANIAKLTKVIQSAVDTLESQGINKIILLARLQQIDHSKSLAKLLRGVDIIVAGPDRLMGDNNDELFSSEHVVDKSFEENYPFKTIDADKNSVIVVNVDGDYKYLGRLVVSFDSAGHIKSDSIDSKISGAYAAMKKTVKKVRGFPNNTVIQIRDAMRKVIEKHYGYILGFSNVYLDGRRHKIRTEETNLGNLTADANLWYAKQLSKKNINISLKNSGGIRTDIGTSKIFDDSNDINDTILSPPYAYKGKKILSGVITEGHVRAALTYDNGLVVLEVTAEELRDLLESGIAESEPGKTPGRFPQVAGIRFSFDISKNPRSDFGNGKRVQTLEIINRKGSVEDVIVRGGILRGNPGRTFRIVTLNYLANGGDNYPFLELSNPTRLNLYDGLGYGDTDFYPKAQLSNDPGLNSEFSFTGGEQDALAEYLLFFHSSPEFAFSDEETPANKDERILEIR